MSCNRTREVLNRTKTEIAEERSSAKNPLSDAEMKALLATVDSIIVAKGKASRRLTAKETTFDDLRGPTGRFRAPMIRKGKTLLVGFSESELKSMFGGK